MPLAAFILAEAVGPRRAIAATVGFVGVLIMRPGMETGMAQAGGEAVGVVLSLGAAAAGQRFWSRWLQFWSILPRAMTGR